MNTKIMYRCNECDELHDNEFDAGQCCPPYIDKVFFCGDCDLEHDSKEEADQCCEGRDQESPEAIRRRIEELEAAGQQRLIP